MLLLAAIASRIYGKINQNFLLVFHSSKKMNGTLDHPDQPDLDAIKMFVGQVPRSWCEKDLRELFEQYGAVYEINVLRDRSQNPPQSKGENFWTSHVRLGVSAALHSYNLSCLLIQTSLCVGALYDQVCMQAQAL